MTNNAERLTLEEKLDLVKSRARIMGFRRHDLEDAVQEVMLSVLEFEYDVEKSNGATETTALTTVIDRKLISLKRVNRRRAKILERATDELALASQGYDDGPRIEDHTAEERIVSEELESLISDIRWGDRYYSGKHRPLVDQRTFTMCQEILDGKVRRTTKQVNMPLSGGLFTCQHCGAMITGERIKRKLKGGGVRIHDYYRCANNFPDADHPSVRWRADDLEDAIHADLETIRIPDDALADWFRTAMQSAFKDIGDVQREQRIAQKKRLADIEAMQERLLNAYLAGTIDEATLAARQTQLRDESAAVAATLATCGDLGPEDVRTALGVFEFAQNAAQIWRGSKMDQKREILESVSLNRMLGDVTLVVEKRKPFDELAKRPFVTNSRGDWTPIELFERETAGWPAELVRILGAWVTPEGADTRYRRPSDSRRSSDGEA